MPAPRRARNERSRRGLGRCGERIPGRGVRQDRAPARLRPRPRLPGGAHPRPVGVLMDLPTFLGVLARVSGLASFVSLSAALLTGLALRTAVLDWAAGNRS